MKTRIPAFFKKPLFFSLVFLLTAFWASGQSIIRDVQNEEETRRSLLVPYAFYTDSLKFSYGVAGGIAGHFQEQSTMFGALMGTTNDSYAGGVLINDIQMPVIDRLFGGIWVFSGKFTDYRSYIDGNPLFVGKPAGTNDSDKDNYIESKGTNTWIRLPFTYVLPIGDGKENPIATYMVDRGFLVSEGTGAKNWNPFKSGRTFIDIWPFFREVKLDSDTLNKSFKTNGLQLSLRHDNRDFPVNPTRGSLERISITRDFGLFDSDTTWTVIEGEFRKYFSFGESKWARQRVLALDVWLATSPTWEEPENGDSAGILHAPPYYCNPTLGGFFKMRGFSSNRFYGKSAVYYSAEYRYMPQWNPFKYVPLRRFNDMDWWQIVGFVELGRVSNEDNADIFFKDLKWDAGVGLRIMISRAVFRLDFAFSDEEMGVWCMVGQPF